MESVFIVQNDNRTDLIIAIIALGYIKFLSTAVVLLMPSSSLSFLTIGVEFASIKVFKWSLSMAAGRLQCSLFSFTALFTSTKLLKSKQH